jgi:hypothetical protein
MSCPWVSEARFGQCRKPRPTHESSRALALTFDDQEAACVGNGVALSVPGDWRREELLSCLDGPAVSVVRECSFGFRSHTESRRANRSRPCGLNCPGGICSEALSARSRISRDAFPLDDNRGANGDNGYRNSENASNAMGHTPRPSVELGAADLGIDHGIAPILTRRNRNLVAHSVRLITS